MENIQRVLVVKGGPKNTQFTVTQLTFVHVWLTSNYRTLDQKILLPKNVLSLT